MQCNTVDLGTDIFQIRLIIINIPEKINHKNKIDEIITSFLDSINQYVFVK